MLQLRAIAFGSLKRQKQWTIKQVEIELRKKQIEIEETYNEKVFLPDFLLKKNTLQSEVHGHDFTQYSNGHR